jgi:biopolymer transport protein ExbB
MEMFEEYLFLLNSFVIWATLITAFICYGLLIDLCFIQRSSDAWYDSTFYWTHSLKHMLTALPLLGLLGTITGLLKTFTQMALNKSVVAQEIISGGIAEAMFTTQLGLIMVIPGLLMLAYLNHKKRGWVSQKAHEIVN